MRISLILFFSFLAACDNHSAQTNILDSDGSMSPQLFTIKLGIQPHDFIQSNGLDAKKNVNEQPAGMNFYQHRWPSENRGSVFFEHGKYSFQLVNVLSVMGVENLDYPDKGLYEFSINAGGAPQSLDFHDAIRKRFLTFLQELKEKGWGSYLYYSDPRLLPDDAIKYVLTEDSFYAIPLGYSITLEQWMQFKDANWMLYADGVFLEITFNRDRNAMDPSGYGSYLFSYKLFGANERGANQMKSNDRPRWQELWVDKIKELKKLRYAKEAELIEKGYTIDTDYIDPKIHPADPVEP